MQCGEKSEGEARQGKANKTRNPGDGSPQLSLNGVYMLMAIEARSKWKQQQRLFVMKRKPRPNGRKARKGS